MYLIFILFVSYYVKDFKEFVLISNEIEWLDRYVNVFKSNGN